MGYHVWTSEIPDVKYLHPEQQWGKAGSVADPTQTPIVTISTLGVEATETKTEQIRNSLAENLIQPVMGAS
jgi:hypothetical protein